MPMDPPIGPDELASMLRRHEGPPEPQKRTTRVPRSFGPRRSATVAAIALLVGSGLGFGAASRLTPSGHAAGTGLGMGFVPDSGWTVLQSGAEAVPQRPAFAIAANVPLHPDDDARGIEDSSGLPYATLLGLPPRGIVIVATFSVPPDLPWRGNPFSKRTLPLRLRDATQFTENATQLRPDRPLGEYQLRARLSGRDVDLHFYFGREEPTTAMIVAAQRQLDRLVVQPTRTTTRVEQRALPLQPSESPAPVPAAANIVDRTLVCTTGIEGGARNVLPSAKTGYRKGQRFQWLGAVSVATPGNPLPSHPDHLRTLVGLTAGWPPPAALKSGGVGYDAQLCKPARASVALSPRGLAGGAAGVFGDTMLCLTPKTVLIRLRVAFHAPAALRLDSKRRWTSATARIDRGQFAVRTTTGRPLVYAEVLDTGQARLFTKGCS